MYKKKLAGDRITGIKQAIKGFINERQDAVHEIALKNRKYTKSSHRESELLHQITDIIPEEHKHLVTELVDEIMRAEGIYSDIIYEQALKDGFILMDLMTNLIRGGD